MTCTRLPGDLEVLRQDAADHRDLEARAYQRAHRQQSRKLDLEGHRVECAVGLSWPGGGAQALADHLWWAGHAIDAYCTRRQRQLDAESIASMGPPPGVPYLLGLSEAEYSRVNTLARTPVNSTA
jgi:hypothetical protein